MTLQTAYLFWVDLKLIEKSKIRWTLRKLRMQRQAVSKFAGPHVMEPPYAFVISEVDRTTKMLEKKLANINIATSLEHFVHLELEQELTTTNSEIDAFLAETEEFMRQV